jgi:diguanylate cyclase (GGDEF)-like protein/hemerythrin-like metal-binding protein/PAS domain S-box-containing protein
VPENSTLKDVFVWSSRFETGLREVDHQHANLVRMINSLSQLAIEGTTREGLVSLLDELQDYAGYHFKTEEDLMQRHALNRDFIASHVHAHQSLYEQIRIVRDLTLNPDTTVPAAIGRLLPFLMKWLLFHVLGTDMRMAHEIMALEQGQTPEIAMETALQRQSESLVVVLDALSEITDNLTRRTMLLQEVNQRLRISETRYALAQRAAHIGSWELDPVTRAFSWSEEAELLFGLRFNDFEHPFDGLMACVHPEDRGAILSEIERMRSGHQRFFVQHRIVQADGSIRWIAATGERLEEDAQNTVRVLGIVRDITEEKLAREQLQETNAQLKLSLAAVERHASDLTTLNDLNEGLQSCLNANEAFEVVEHTLSRLNLGCGGALAILPHGEKVLKVAARWGDGGGLLPTFDTSMCWAMRRGQRHLVRHATDGPVCKHFDPLPSGPHMCYPLLVLGETLGLLCVRTQAEIDDHEWERANHLASMVAESLKLALSNVRLRETLHEQAIRDPLTRLLNRRYLDETLPREITRARRERRPLSLVILDLDHFKNVNDTWGHEAGDAVLSHLATLLRQHLRASDLACRFGGEEFVVVMLGATLAEAHERIEELANHVRTEGITHGKLYLPPVTFSAGLVEVGPHGESAEQLLRAADRALYAAKEAGRDCLRDASTEE